MERPPTPREVFGQGPFHRAPELLLQPPNPAGGGAAAAAPSQFLTSSGPTPFPGQTPGSPPSFHDMAAVQPPPTPPKVIDKLRPGSDLHNRVREKLDAMLRFSENAMRHHYSRWNFMERKTQAYLADQDYEKLLNSIRDKKGEIPPEPIQVVVPYTYATLHSAATFIASVLMGRKPMFPLAGIRGTASERARYMEQALQQNLDASMGQETLWQLIWDSLVYSFGCVRIGWETHEGQAIRLNAAGERTIAEETTFAGNVLTSVDPYKCFPDPRVPLHKCPEKGDFIFTMMEVSETVMKDMERQGHFKYVKEALESSHGRQTSTKGHSDYSHRRLRIGQDGVENLLEGTHVNVVGFREVYEGTVRLISKDWGLGDSEQSELWKFTWMRSGQILQAEPTGMLHNKHPYSFCEPTSFGYEFMSLSQGELISVFQDILSWLVSSRMENVRSAINNSFVADPARIEMNDIRSTAIGRIIRLKQSAMGLPINDAIKQLQVNDVTGSHLGDINMIRLLADTATGVNDNMRGIQKDSGRRSATEARMTIQAGASRLSQLAIRISSQCFLPMANQMIFNLQQFMPDEMWIETTGDEGARITPDMLIGDFNYQVSDGSLPLDKAALQETWKEILFGIARDPELRQRFSLPDIFEYVAELGGAKDIERFKQAPQIQPTIAPPGEEPGAEGAQPVGSAVPQLPASLAFQPGGGEGPAGA